jgi:hypothetical protein
MLRNRGRTGGNTSTIADDDDIFFPAFSCHPAACLLGSTDAHQPVTAVLAVDRRGGNRSESLNELTVQEASALRFQSGISKRAGRGGRRYLPYVFTEQGVAMLSSVLRSRRAVEVNIEIMRAFVQVRRFLSANKELGQKLAQLERKIGVHDEQIQAIFNAIRQLMTPPEPKKRKIGFLVRERPATYRRA